MAFDGIVSFAMSKELEAALVSGKVDKIYQPEKDELLFTVRTFGNKYKLYMSCANNHAGAYLTDGEYTNPASPSSFCMLMRKHLLSAHICAIRQYRSERILEIDFETKDEMGYTVLERLIIEVMGKHSNIVLINIETGRIIDAIKRVSIDVSRVRQILPGGQYEYPPQQDKISFFEIGSDIDKYRDNAEGLLDEVQGVSPLIARELASDPSNKLSQMLSAINSCELRPCVYLKEDGSPADFHAFHIPEYDSIYECLDFDTISAATEYFYTHKQTANRIRQKSTSLLHSVSTYLKKLYLKKKKLSEDLLDAQDSDKYRLYGELLTANAHAVKTGDKVARVINYYNGEEIEIPLDERFAPYKNAQLYFKKYNKSKTAIKEKQIQLDSNEENIIYLESVLSFIENAPDTETLENIRDELIESGFLRRRMMSKKDASKKKKITFNEYTTSFGHRVYAGRNNKENDMLTFKTASKGDIWFHTKNIPGSHVILFTEGTPLREISEAEIHEVAAIAAFHSKAQSSENVPVDYTMVKYVKKPNGAKPGMCIFTDNRTVYMTPKLPK